MKDKENNVGFFLKKITTEQFAIIEEVYQEVEKIHLRLRVGFELDEIEKTISVFLLCKFEQNKHPFLMIEVGCHFGISEDSWKVFSQEDTQKIIIPQGFMKHLVILTIGTTRGVLHAKTENTSFNKFLLNTIDANRFIKEDISFDISS